MQGRVRRGEGFQAWLGRWQRCSEWGWGGVEWGRQGGLSAALPPSSQRHGDDRVWWEGAGACRFAWPRDEAASPPETSREGEGSERKGPGRGELNRRYQQVPRAQHFG